MDNKLSVRINKYLGAGTWAKLSRTARMEYAKLGAHGVWRAWRKKALPDITKLQDPEPSKPEPEPVPVQQPVAPIVQPVEVKPARSFLGRLFGRLFRR